MSVTWRSRTIMESLSLEGRLSTQNWNVYLLDANLQVFSIYQDVRYDTRMTMVHSLTGNTRQYQGVLYFKNVTRSTATKVKQSIYRPGQAQRVPGGSSSQITRQSAYEGGMVVCPTHRPPLSPFLFEVESTPGQKCGRKDYFNTKFQWHHRESNTRSSDL